MIKGKKIAIFDMDGTLIDSVGIWNEVDRKLIQTAGGKDIPADEMQKQRDWALRNFNRAQNPYLKYCNYLKDKYALSFSVDKIHTLRYEIADDYLKNVIDYKKGAEKVLRELRDNGIALVIATTTKKTNMDIYRAENKNIMTKAKLDDFFSIIYTREDAQKIKPDPEIYLRIMNELHVSPVECIIFEDSLIGIEAAKNAGVESIIMYDKYSDHEREQINRLADYQFKDYEEVLTVIQAELFMA